MGWGLLFLQNTVSRYIFENAQKRRGNRSVPFAPSPYAKRGLGEAGALQVAGCNLVGAVVKGVEGKQHNDGQANVADDAGWSWQHGGRWVCEVGVQRPETGGDS